MLRISLRFLNRRLFRIQFRLRSGICIWFKLSSGGTDLGTGIYKPVMPASAAFPGIKLRIKSVNPEKWIYENNSVKQLKTPADTVLRRCSYPVAVTESYSGHTAVPQLRKFLPVKERKKPFHLFSELIIKIFKWRETSVHQHCLHLIQSATVKLFFNRQTVGTPHKIGHKPFYKTGGITGKKLQLEKLTGIRTHCSLSFLIYAHPRTGGSAYELIKQEHE